MSNELIIVQVSFPKTFDCDELCRHLILSKKAICIHKFGDIISYYEWNSNLETSDEYLIHIKCFRSNFHQIETTVIDHHPYEVAEIIGLPIDDVSAPYLDWATNR